MCKAWGTTNVNKWRQHWAEWLQKQIVYRERDNFTPCLRDSVQALRRQIANTTLKDLLAQAVKSKLHSHPMSAIIGQKACWAVEAFIEIQASKNVICKCRRCDGEESFLGYLQLFCDKTQASLNAGALIFYLSYATLIYFTEDCRRNQISKRTTVRAYPRAMYDVQTGESSEIEQKGSVKGWMCLGCICSIFSTKALNWRCSPWAKSLFVVVLWQIELLSVLEFIYSLSLQGGYARSRRFIVRKVRGASKLPMPKVPCLERIHCRLNLWNATQSACHYGVNS